MPHWMNVTKDRGAHLFPSNVIVNGDLCAMPTYFPEYTAHNPRKFLLPRIYIALIGSVGLCAVIALSFAYI